ncbi:glycerol-3-phosphate dehydrogenase [Elasticomyces elasticus]|uniref:Glycerol-3-phosphate dehydrogenase n=1 Tax=Exophiala sideris TaxID=1016849 RepID=A0ABR0J4G6_9EURO|nr:glycerol-3-phosphate dehydrogenase [Elasticomyces elasticus]KAK5026879.1 glycerol-3-phosphate dehydrogenase [Exophiala sideris]KAK5033883.1 glycerol-3-phosphate dehydrogenase [Exophiala sideris]KAK5055842.1 glycerol-3-phosphate dehydrogenase [Exophiala sideris]KAK5180825.1 glycerol-3-phosphate dehydrogenase [Eurotiomycetes sp. CCFEE 6388]
MPLSPTFSPSSMPQIQPRQHTPTDQMISTSGVTSATLVPAPALASSRYNRQLLVPQVRLRGQNHLLQSKVLVIGLGGLGCPAALYLAGAGVGTLGLMDGDTVELGNLHRQIAHTESAAEKGLSKVKSAAARCHEINSTIKYVVHPTRATAENILDVVRGYDLVLDCSDNPATRYLVSDACVVLGKVLVSGAAQRGEGSLIVLNSPPTGNKGPCYRCVFPRPPPPEMVRGCSEIGILGPVVGVIGTLMAGEAIKIIARGGHIVGEVQEQELAEGKAPTPHTMLLYNTYAADPKGMFRTITLRGRRKDCLACGDSEALAKKGQSRITAETIARGRLDYQAFCGVMEDVKVLDDESRVDATDFLGGENPGLVVDVREEHEYELGTKVEGSVNIPISRILRLGGGAFDELERLRGSPAGPGVQSSGSRTGPDGGMVDNESHIPTMNGPDRGTINQETHISEIHSGIHETTVRGGGMVNQETHVPVSEGVSPDGGMLSPESHIPLTRQSESDFPDPPQEVQTREGAEQQRDSTPVYFVCQRGNDSQIAAQRLIERVRADNGSESKSIWGWIGDVKGGFLAMEKFAGSTT